MVTSSDGQEFDQLLSDKGDIDLEAKFDQWEQFYNFQRPHWGLQWKNTLWISQRNENGRILRNINMLTQISPKLSHYCNDLLNLTFLPNYTMSLAINHIPAKPSLARWWEACLYKSEPLSG